MTYASDQASGIVETYEFFGVPAIYTDKAGDTCNVTAIIDFDLNQYGDVAEVMGKTAVVSVRVSEIPRVPRKGESYTIDGTVYVVDTALNEDNLEHSVLVA